MPAHTHSGTAISNGSHNHGTAWGENGVTGSHGRYGTASNISGSNNGSDNDNWEFATTTNGAHTHSLSINTTGTGAAHNNIQPYIAVFLWKRIS